MSQTAREIDFLVTYRCGSCQADLQAPAERRSAWLRCPACGRGGLPPDRILRRKPVPPPSPDEDILRIEAPPEPRGMTPVAVAEVRPIAWDIRTPHEAGPSRPSAPFADSRDPEEPGSGLRVAYASVLFISLTLLLFSYLDQSVMGTAICGGLAVIALVLLVLSGRPRPGA